MSIGYKEIHNAIFRSSSVEKTDRFKNLIEKLKPKIVIEIGTYKGLSTAVLASIAEKVYTFDIVHQSCARDIWVALNVNRKIRYVIIQDIYEIGACLEDIKFDFAFMDARHHDYVFVRRLFNMLSEAGIKRILVDGAEERFPTTLRLVEEENMKRLNQNQAYWEKK